MTQPDLPGGPLYLPGFAPSRVIDTQRLVLRAWEPQDTAALKNAIDRNLDHLAPWIPWAPQYPKPLEVMVDEVARFQREFASGVAWIYGVYRRDDNLLIGGVGLHPRIGPGGVEIGYWLDREATGNGYVTEAVSTLVELAFAHAAVTHVEIRCDPRNVASAAIPQRLGFIMSGMFAPTSNDPTVQLPELMVWRRDRSTRS